MQVTTFTFKRQDKIGLVLINGGFHKLIFSHKWWYHFIHSKATQCCPGGKCLSLGVGNEAVKESTQMEAHTAHHGPMTRNPSQHKNNHTPASVTKASRPRDKFPRNETRIFLNKHILVPWCSFCPIGQFQSNSVHESTLNYVACVFVSILHVLSKRHEYTSIYKPLKLKMSPFDTNIYIASIRRA